MFFNRSSIVALVLCGAVYGAYATQPAPGRFVAKPANLFAARSWQPPPPPAPKAEAPKAPALPFHFLGKLLQDGDVTAFVSQGTVTHLLRKGDVLANYRVDEITPSEMTFVYLPLNEKQRLSFGSAN
jgi:hypothetical protein